MWVITHRLIVNIVGTFLGRKGVSSTASCVTYWQKLIGISLDGSVG
jgi:hypothetical protein